MPDRSLLYLDVDGVLNPYVAKPHKRPDGYETHRLLPAEWLIRHPNTPRARVKPLRVWLNPAHGAALLELADVFELVWATTWGHDANTHIGPLIGLPSLSVVEWTPHIGRGPEGTFWKTPQLVEHADGRAFAWVDDDIATSDRRYVDREHGPRALLHYVDPAKGLLEDDFATLRSWGIRQHAVDLLAQRSD